MAAPKPNAQPAKKPLTDAELAARTQALLRDPMMKRLADEARAGRARGESVSLEEMKKELDG